MISDTNKAFSDLASATYGMGWQRVLAVARVVRDAHRASILANKHDIDPRPDEVREMIRAAKEKQAEIAEAIEAMERAMSATQ